VSHGVAAHPWKIALPWKIVFLWKIALPWKIALTWKIALPEAKLHTPKSEAFRIRYRK